MRLGRALAEEARKGSCRLQTQCCGPTVPSGRHHLFSGHRAQEVWHNPPSLSGLLSDKGAGVAGWCHQDGLKVARLWREGSPAWVQEA